MSPARPTLKIVGRRMDAEDYRLREFLSRVAQPYDWHEAGTAEADELLASLGLADAALPVVVDGDENYTGVTIESLAREWPDDGFAYELRAIVIASNTSGTTGVVALLSK